MSPFTSEESITSAYVKNENPDVIINIVDATNLSRSLFFTTQLLELGIPVVVANSFLFGNKAVIINNNAIRLCVRLPDGMHKQIFTESGLETEEK